MKKFGVAGFGNMGEAFTKGILNSNPGLSLGVLEPDSKRAAYAQSEYKAAVYTSLSELTAASDITLIAIKPQYLEKAFNGYRAATGKEKIVSCAAGTPISCFQKALQTDLVIRYMPNLSATVGQSFTGMAVPDGAPEEFVSQAVKLAEASGKVLQIPESLMSAVTGLSGSGLAFVFSFIHALALGGVKEGIAYPDSLKGALQTVQGAVSLLEATGDHPQVWLSKVISPAGTTIQGIQALEQGSFTSTVMSAVQAASRRSRELEEK